MMSRMRTKTCVLLTMAVVIMFLSSGCTALRGKESSGAEQQSTAQRAPAKNSPVYYDFGDVLLPKELKVDREESFVFDSPGMTAGVLTLKGRVDSASLIQFFENKMPADGWRLISSIKSPRSKMLFQKETRWCVISITEGQLNTGVEIWVSPSLPGRGVGLSK